MWGIASELHSRHYPHAGTHTHNQELWYCLNMHLVPRWRAQLPSWIRVCTQSDVYVNIYVKETAPFVCFTNTSYLKIARTITMRKPNPVPTLRPGGPQNAKYTPKVCSGCLKNAWKMHSISPFWTLDMDIEFVWVLREIACRRWPPWPSIVL